MRCGQSKLALAHSILSHFWQPWTGPSNDIGCFFRFLAGISMTSPFYHWRLKGARICTRLATAQPLPHRAGWPDCSGAKRLPSAQSEWLWPPHCSWNETFRRAHGCLVWGEKIRWSLVENWCNFWKSGCLWVHADTHTDMRIYIYIYIYIFIR